MRQNPVRRTRKERHLTLEQAAAEAGIHVQAFFLQEQGVYPDLLPAIVAWLAKEGAYLPNLQKEYHEFQRDKRRVNGEQRGLALYEFGPPGQTHPIVQFRNDLELSRLGFAKAFCIHPGLLYRVERGMTQGLSRQIKNALLDAGMTKQAIKELEYRSEEQ